MFQGSVLAYNLMLNEAEWIPMRGLANDSSWGEERPMVALANYIPCVQKEGERIARLGVSRVVSSLDDDTSTTSMDEEEESRLSDAPGMGQRMDTDHEADVKSERAKGDVSGQKSPEEGDKICLHLDRCQCSQNWESIMEESEGLAFDDPCLGSDTTIMGVDSPSVPLLSPPTRLRGSAPRSAGSPMEAGGMPPLMPMVAMLASGVDTVEVHVPQSKLDNL